MVKNLTTWEYFSWEKIGYLEKFKRKYGSPFYLGLRKNIRVYFYPKINSHYDWKPFRYFKNVAK